MESASSGPAITNGPQASFSRDPASGSARWFYQYSPHDEHDYDGVNEQILLDMPFAGKMQKVLIHIDRNGYVYVIERTTGTVLSADPTGRSIPAAASIFRPDVPSSIEEKQTKLGETVRNICPTASGAKDWNPSSFSPQTGLALYSAREHVHGLDEHGSQLHRGHALCRRAGPHEARARRQSRRTDRVGSGGAASRLGGEGELSRFGRARS